MGKTPPTPDNFTPAVCHPERAYIKKPHGGLWTSPPDLDYGCKWLEWSYREGFGEWPNWPMYEMTARPDADIYVIDSAADLDRLMERYAVVNEPIMKLLREERHELDVPEIFKTRVESGFDFDAWSERQHTTPDFDAIAAAGIDAIRLTERGFGQTHIRFNPAGYDLYGWDCACTLWLRWVFTDVRELGVWEMDPELERIERLLEDEGTVEPS